MVGTGSPHDDVAETVLVVVCAPLRLTKGRDHPRFSLERETRSLGELEGFLL